MHRAEGMAVVPWGTLGCGLFKPSDRTKEVGSDMHLMSDGREALVSDNIANRNEVAITSVARACILLKAPYVFPAVGGRKLDHIKGKRRSPKSTAEERGSWRHQNRMTFRHWFSARCLGREYQLLNFTSWKTHTSRDEHRGWPQLKRVSLNLSKIRCPCVGKYHAIRSRTTRNLKLQWFGALELMDLYRHDESTA